MPKISQLPAASTPLAGSELIPLVQGGVTDSASAQVIANTLGTMSGSIAAASAVIYGPVIVSATLTGPSITSAVLTGPSISNPVLSGTATGVYALASPGLSGTATGTYELGGAPTITSAALTGPAISSPVLSGTATGTYTLAGTPTVASPTISTPTITGTATLTGQAVLNANVNAFAGLTITNNNASNDAVAGVSMTNSEGDNLTISVPDESSFNVPGGVGLIQSSAASGLVIWNTGQGDIWISAKSTFPMNNAAIHIIGGTQSLSLGGGGLATSATTGFPYIPHCAGAPTAVPSGVTGYSPIVYDTTNNKLWVYNGAWKGAVFS